MWEASRQVMSDIAVSDEYSQSSFTNIFEWASFLYDVFPLSDEFVLLQVQLLLQYLKNDPRKAVKRLAIQDLKLLANKMPHTWSRENIQVNTFLGRSLL